MAGKTFSVGIASETKAFKQGIETGVIAPVKTSIEALDKLANSRGPEQLEDGMRDAQRQTERLGDEVKDTARDIEREFRDSYSGVKRSADDAHDGIKRGANEAKDEVTSTAREGAASFSGEWSDVGDVVQESLANAFSGFGPGGALVGILAAAGAGALITSLQDAQAESDALKEKFKDMYKSAAEEGRNYLDEAQIIAEANDLIFNPERAEEEKRLRKEAAALGLDASTYILAMAGDEEAINTALTIGNQKRQERRDWANENLAAERETGTITDAQGSHMDALLGKLQERKTLTDENKKAADLALEVESEVNRRAAEGNAASKEAIEQRGRDWQAFADRVAATPNPVLKPTIDTSGADAELSRFIARRRPQIEVDIFYKPGTVNR